jgi:hypothetical protein
MIKIQEVPGSELIPKKVNSCLWKNEMMIRENPSTNRLKTKPNTAEKKVFNGQTLAL